jgi:hypothetical protein
MAKKIRKARSSKDGFGRFSPKRGKQRMVMSKIKSASSAKNTVLSVPYVRHGKLTQQLRSSRSRWGKSVKDFIGKSEVKIIKMLICDGYLPDWEGCLCPHCAKGKLSKLSYKQDRRAWCHRCSAFGCQKYVKPHDFHPIFFGGSGKSYTSLADQAAVLFCATVNLSRVSAQKVLDVDHKIVDRIYGNLEETRMKYVEKKQQDILFGVGGKWLDVEADEVDVGKGVAPANNNKLIWEQWGGIVQRGASETLVLYRLKPKLTSLRAPGPGPIRKSDWLLRANKFLKGRNVVLHTDGARSYKLQIPGVLHDHVVHQKKKIMIKGKSKWALPKYVKTFKHKLPDGSFLRVKGGTQVIDRFWGTLRKHLGTTHRQPGSPQLRRKIRCAQWLYWNRGKNLWEETGSMLKQWGNM